MLVVSRKQNERIYLKVGTVTVVVTVAEIDRGKVRIGIDAPQSVRIYREEVLPPETPKAKE